MSEILYDTEDIANIFGVTTERVRQYAKKLGIGQNLGGLILFTRGEFEQMAEHRDDIITGTTDWNNV